MDVESTRRRTITNNSVDEDTHILVDDDNLGRSYSPDSETTDEESGSHLINDNDNDKPETVQTQKKPPWRARYCTEKYKKAVLAIFVLILGACIIVMVATTFGIYDELPKKSCSDLVNEKEFAPYIFDGTSGEFVLCHNGQALLAGNIGKGRSYIEEHEIDEYSYSNETELSLKRPDGQLNVSNDHCVQVEWKGPASTDLPLMDCFYITNGSWWFGGYETLNQLWPINNDRRTMTPFLPRDFIQDHSNWFGPILHPVWYNSYGVVLYVDEDVPLHVSINDPSGGNTTASQLCLQALPYSLNCFPHSSNVTSLKYTVCGFQNITRAVKFFLSESRAISNPLSFPSLDLFLKPIWSTWAAFKTNISQETIEHFARNITQHNFSISLLEIDDKYSTQYGELSFDPVKFPNATNINSTLHNLGVPGITAWVTPFVDPKASNFTEMASSGNLLPGTLDMDSNSVALVKWWNGYGGVINYINELTRDWQSDKLEMFVSKYSLSGLKFDAGGESYIPRCIYIDNLTHPGQFSKAYVEFVASQSYHAKSEVRVGYFNQKEPVLFRILDFKSVWGLDHGLHSVITTVLSLGIAGYPFILPDMIGGNDVDSDSELYVRWLQLNTFLPVMQFSYPPWRFNNNTIIEHTRYMIQLHEEITNNYTISLIQDAINFGYPIIRPLWWIAPNDKTAILTNDQFLVGDTLLVAPVIYPNSTDRRVYFPKGLWKCLANGCKQPEVITGPTYRTYSVSLTDILFFIACESSIC